MRLALILLMALLFGCMQQGTAPELNESIGQNESPPNMTVLAQNETDSAGIRVFRDIEYSGETAMLLDLYVPQGESLPLIIYVHGGAWTIGSKNDCQYMFLAQRGYAVACIDYRLSDKAIFPAQIDDVQSSIKYLRANAAKYGIDGSRFGIWGDSAGGHLAALAGTKGENDSRVQAVADWFGPVDFFDVENYTDPASQFYDYQDAASRLVGGPLRQNEELVLAANPITFASADDPPFLIIHGTEDDVVPVAQSQKLHEALLAAGVDSELMIVEMGGHGFSFLDAADNLGPEFSATMAFFDRHLKVNASREGIAGSGLAANASKKGLTYSQHGNESLLLDLYLPANVSGTPPLISCFRAQA